MRTRDLIAILSKYEPNAEVTVGGYPIKTVVHLPGYYDGSYEKIYYDENGDPVGGEITYEWLEVRIIATSLEETAWEVEVDNDDYFPICAKDQNGKRLPDDHRLWEKVAAIKESVKTMREIDRKNRAKVKLNKAQRYGKTQK